MRTTTAILVAITFVSFTHGNAFGQCQRGGGGSGSQQTSMPFQAGRGGTQTGFNPLLAMQQAAMQQAFMQQQIAAQQMRMQQIALREQARLRQLYQLLNFCEYVGQRRCVRSNNLCFAAVMFVVRMTWQI